MIPERLPWRTCYYSPTGRRDRKRDGTVKLASKHDVGPILGREEEEKKLRFFSGLFIRQTTLEHYMYLVSVFWTKPFCNTVVTDTP
jgi:hypothetical protein